jgi:ribosome-binding protein aMBF1 (putative translation factor)
MRERDFYEQRAKDYIKDERVRRGVSYKELARRLDGMGVAMRVC